MGGILMTVVIIIVVAIAIQAIFQLGGLLIAVIAWMLAGMFAGRIMRGKGYGPVADVLLGLAGGVLGSLILGLLRLGWIGDIWLVGNIVVGVIGAVILIYIVRAFGNRSFGR
jgi:uncharacterized membrane protein YeaQ/YmgE (transglycosylase-associated protein family)